MRAPPNGHPVKTYRREDQTCLIEYGLTPLIQPDLAGPVVPTVVKTDRNAVILI